MLLQLPFHIRLKQVVRFVRLNMMSRLWQPWVACGQGVKPGFTQQAAQRNQGQTDQTVEVVSLHSLEQTDTKTFGFKAASTVVGHFISQVGTDLGFFQGPELHPVQIMSTVGSICCTVIKRKCGMKGYPMPGAGQQLGSGGFEVSGLAYDGLPVFTGLI